MPNGVDGWGGYYLSAYGLAVKHGFHGSEADWLEYLRAGELELKLEDGKFYWKTDKDLDWTELPEYGEIHQELIKIQNTAGEILEESKLAVKNAVKGAEQCQTDCMEKCNTLMSTAKEDTETLQKSVTDTCSALVSESEQKVTAAVEEIHTLSAECEEVKAVNAQSIAIAEHLSNAITVSRTPLSADTDALESGCLYIVY